MMFPSVTHVALGERNKYVQKSDREQGKRERNIERQWKRDKLRGKKECADKRERCGEEGGGN